MSPLVMGSAKVEAPSGARLLEQSSALESALVAGGEQLVASDVEAARAVVAKAGQRLALRGDHTVVALAGATGSGKSSLFNALAGAPLAVVGARRPTTAAPAAAVWGDDPAGELLDWLGIDQRHGVAASPADAPSGNGSGARDALLSGTIGGLDGLVLLDLPDFDSREEQHRVEAERVLALCDVFVWVTDPQKYADAVLHDDYVRELADHEAVTLVVLNQSDRLDADGVTACRDDLRAILADDGLAATVLTTSARTGAGVPELRQRIANAVAGHAASRQRLSADLGSVATRLRRGVADTETSLGSGADSALVQALSRAAGVPVVLDAVEEDFRRTSLARTGWIFTRWRRRLRADPLARLRLDASSPVLGEVDRADVRAVLGRSSLPAPSPAARSAVRLATHELTDRAGAGLPVPWAEAVSAEAAPDQTRLEESLDRAVVGTSLRARDPGWWRVLGLAQWVLGLATVAGFLWLATLAVVGWLQLPDLPTPTVGALPWPFLLLAGGLVLGLVCAGLARGMGRRGALRRRRVVEGRLETAIAAVADERVVTPARAVLERHARTRAELDRVLAR